MKNLIVGLLFVLFSIHSVADKKIYLTSLEWPPYSGKELAEQGASVAVAKAAFKAMGYELIVDFYPWSRAVRLAQDSDSKYSGYFPEYYSSSIEQDFIFSAPMGTGPLGFVESKSNPITWNTLKDLKASSIGTVQDYVNTETFDQMAANGELQVKPVISDLLNIKKVAAGRVDLAVIDKHVLGYLLRTEDSLKGVANKVQFNEKLLEDKQLFICFKKTDEGKELVKIFNEGLKKIDIAEVMSDHFN